MAQNKPTLEYGRTPRPKTRWWLIWFLLAVGLIAVVRSLILL